MLTPPSSVSSPLDIAFVRVMLARLFPILVTNIGMLTLDNDLVSPRSAMAPFAFAVLATSLRWPVTFGSKNSLALGAWVTNRGLSTRHFLALRSEHR